MSLTAENIKDRIDDHLQMLEELLKERQNGITVACERLDSYRDDQDWNTKFLMLKTAISQYEKTVKEIKIWKDCRYMFFIERK